MTFDENDLRRRMVGAVNSLKEDFIGLRTGRASTALLDTVMVDAYGSKMPINQVASLSTPEARLILIQVWDQSMVDAVEKSIRETELGLNPQTEGSSIRIPIPELSEDRRIELVKVAGKYAEQAKISIRNVRRDIVEATRKLQKDKEISEDEKRDAENKIQNITDEYIKEIDSMLSQKEIDIKKV
jgi:ribosome recycling factor